MSNINLEMIWLLIPICALLSQLGGSDYAPKAFRRFGIPILLAGAVWYFVGFSWVLIPFMVCQWAVSTLPFTLIGDSIPGNKLNWAWIPFWATIKCTPALWFNLEVYPAVLICGAVMALFAILSNVPKTAKWFQWKWVELFHGFMPATCVCLAVTI